MTPQRAKEIYNRLEMAVRPAGLVYTLIDEHEKALKGITPENELPGEFIEELRAILKILQNPLAQDTPDSLVAQSAEVKAQLRSLIGRYIPAKIGL